MTRGNQREKAREKSQKEAAGQVCFVFVYDENNLALSSHGRMRQSVVRTPAVESPFAMFSKLIFVKKKKTTMSGAEQAKAKEEAAKIMREKQAKGRRSLTVRYQ